MGYSIHIERAEPISLDEWKAAVEAVQGVRLDSSDLEVRNPATGEIMIIRGADGDVALFDSESDEWFKQVFWFQEGRSTFKGPGDWDTNRDSPLRRAAFAIASQLGAELVGDEGERYV